MTDATARSDRRLAAEPIAIVGMAGLFPMAENYRHYWQNIVDALDCTTEVPETHWRPEDYFDPEPSTDPARPDTTYCTRGGFIPATEFSPGEFGMPPNLLEVTTTVQLLSLIVARDVLRDAGATGSDWYDSARTGVVLGVTGPMPLTHPMAARLETPVLKEVVRSCGLTDADAEAIAEKYLLAFPPWEENTFPGLLGNVTAGRIANRLDLGGMNCAVDAACASSLSALRLACSELSDGRADLMITGGCDTENTIFGYMCFSRTHALSKGGRIKPFDDTADGTLVGEGIGMLALKRLADAERDGDRVYAVIRGIGSSSDGRFGSIYAPRASGQELALRRAYVDADCAPETIGLFEGHATGTAVGDRTELTALGAVLEGAEPGSAAIGSVKSQIGHTKGAAGTASLMKLALGLHHKVLPPTINVETPSRAIGADSPLYLNTRLRPWIADPRHPRRAAASAMGFGGTNFHVVLQEASADRAAVLHRGARAHVWHAADPDALQVLLRSDAPATEDAVPAGHARVGFVSRTDDEAAELRTLAVDLIAGESATHPRGVHYRRRALPDLKVGALFAGQGSQYVDMGLRAACDLPPVGAAFDAAAMASPDLASVVFPPPLFGSSLDAEAQLRRTEYAQPAIGALAVGQFRVLRELGLDCSAFLGHSFGELVALWAAGALADDDVVRLARARGAAMAPPVDQPDYDPGAMAAVAAGRAEVEALLAAHPGVTVCNDNAPDQVVIGGPTAAVVATVDALGTRARLLPVAAAFHTEAVGHAVEAFRAALADTAIGRPAGLLVANTDGATYGDDADANRAVLAEQLRRPVEFAAGLRRLADEGVTVLVEFGPRHVLTGLARRTLGDDVIAIPTDAGPSGDSAAALLSAAVRLAVLGAPLAGLNRHAAAPFEKVVPQGMTVTLTGMTHRPAARTEAYRTALRDGYTIATPAAPAPALPAAPASIAPVPTPAPAPAAPQPVVAASSSGDHMALHSHYLDSQLRITEGLVAVLGRQPAEAPLDASVLAAVESVTASTVAISRGHAQANEVLAALAGLAGGASVTSAPAPVAARAGNGAAPPAVLDAAPAATNGHAMALLDIPVQNGAPAPAGPDAFDPDAFDPDAFDPDAFDPDAFDPDAFAPASARQTAPGVDAVSVRAALLAVVAEKTGYPVGMVDPGMDLEADLGIDSIKRVQILGAVSERIPGLPQVGPEQLAELRSVDDIVDVLAAGAPVPAGVDAGAVRSALLAVVAEKTGYPVEMVDRAMDLEADLGIDSIKRVQILGAVSERIPGLPQVGPEQLAELRSVDDLVGVLAVGDASTAPASTTPASTTPASTTPASTTPAAAGPDAASVRAALVAVVAEKTGYPVGMVDPGMDLEADLGIDSIKRVQILGAVSERIPGLPQVGPEQLAELRSVDDLVGVLAGPSAPSEVAAPATAIEVVIDPTPRRAEITLVPLPAPDRLDRPFAESPVALVVEIGAGASAQLTNALEQRGFLLRRLTLPPASDLGAWDGASTAAAVAAALPERLDACVVLLGAQGCADAALADAVLVAAGTTAALTRTAAHDTRAAFVTVTRIDGALGHDAPASINEALLGGVTGLVKTLAREAPGVFARAVDIAPGLDEAAAADVLVAEMYDPALTTEVGIDAGRRRSTPVLVDVEEAGLDRSAPDIGADDVLLVTGGARGITARCVVELAAHSGAEFLLLGRTPLREDPEWAVGVDDPGLQSAAIAAAAASTPREVAALVSGVAAQREVRATLDAVSAAGGRARYLAADVTDADAVRTALGADAARVTGLVHGAGALADAALVDKTPDAVRRVLAPKLAGLRAVLAALDGAPKHVVLFGSVAGVLGNPGQADYAAANEALDRVAAALAGPDRHATCIHWGAWDGGMVTPELKALFAARGVPLLDLDTGAAAFVEQFAASRSAQRSVLVGPAGSLAPAEPAPAPASVSRRDLFALTRDPVVDDHRVGAHPVLPAAAALGWMLRGAEQAHRDLVAVGCRDLEVHRGIVLNATVPAELELHLDAGRVEGAQVFVRAALRSTDRDGRVTPHFGTTVVLAARPAVAPAPDAPPTWRLGEGPEDGLGVYADADLFHGPLLQGVRRLIERTPTRLVAECRLPDARLAGGGWASSLLSPVLGDVVLQAACVLGVWYLDAGCLPLSVGRVELYAPLPDDEPFVLVVDDLRPGANGVTVGVGAHAPDGTLLQRWSAVTAVSTPDMAAKFAEAVALRAETGR